MLKLSNIAMYEFWYDYVTPKYVERSKLCFVGTDSFIFSIKIKMLKQDMMLRIMDYKDHYRKEK